MQYDNTNQSQPLRLIIFFLIGFCGACSPFFFPRDIAAPNYAVAALAAFGGAALWWRERGQRQEQLERLQREYALGDLSVDEEDQATGVRRRRQLRECRSQRRFIILYGTELQLREALVAAAPYRRRFQQSATVVVPVTSDPGDDPRDAAKAALGGPLALRAAGSWLVDAANPGRWRAYFDELLDSRGGADGRTSWVALNFRGRVLGSNFGCPVWDELLAAVPPDSQVLSTEPASSTARPAEVLDAQAAFYAALCGGDRAAMADLFIVEDDPELSFAEQVDDKDSSATKLTVWDKMLAEGACPELLVASQDAVPRGPYEAVSTCIEIPVIGPTLLATQTWRLEEEGWKLLSHRTIPYANSVEARVTLRCDHRGCICFGKQLNAMR